ncbi:MAG: nucleotidyltransferase domain-containing protein [Patescibacteria group bacterium]
MAKKTIKSNDAKQYAKDYVRYIKEKYNLSVKSAYLFGSFANGKSRDWSDIDVCIVSNKFKHIDPLVYLWTKRRDIDIERGIEPVGIHPDDFVEENPIAYEVKHKSVLLKV